MGKRKREGSAAFACQCCEKSYVQEHSLCTHMKKEHPNRFDKSNRPIYVAAPPMRTPLKTPMKTPLHAGRTITISIPTVAAALPVKRGRGRPPKIKTGVAGAASSESTGSTASALKAKRQSSGAGPTSPRATSPRPGGACSPGRSPPHGSPRAQIPVALRNSMREKIVNIWKQFNVEGVGGRAGRRGGGGPPPAVKGQKPPEYVSVTDMRELELSLAGRAKAEKLGPGGVPLNALHRCLFPQQEANLTWYCEGCGCFHMLTSNTVICPFQKRHGWRVVDVPADGDCFYYCVQNCLASDRSLCAGRRQVTVKQMRAWVAAQCGEDQFEFYQIQAAASPKDPHLNFIRDSLKAGMGARSALAATPGLTPASSGRVTRSPVRSPAPAPRSSLGGAFSSIIASAEAAMISISNALRTRGPAPQAGSPSSDGSAGEGPDDDTNYDGGSMLNEPAVLGEEDDEEEPTPKRMRNTRSAKGSQYAVSVSSVPELQAYIRREGRLVGQAASMWADSFAYMIVGNVLKLTILMIDMERRRGCLPYRFLHTYNRAEAEATVTSALLKALVTRNNREEAKSVPVGDENARYIVLKRTGPAGHFQYIEDVATGCACFSHDRLPDVFRSLWGIR